jgi:hypothetical protein
MPTLTFAVVFYFCPMAIDLSPEAIKLILMTIFVTTFIFPFLSTFVLLYVAKRNFSMNDLFMHDHRERFYPFLFTGFFYCAITFIFIKNHYHPLIVIIMGGISLTVIVIAIITYFWKVSIHAVGILGLLGYMLIISFYYPYELMIYPISGVALLAGLLLSARMNLNAHTPNQLFAGALIGLVLSMASFVFLHRYGMAYFYH